MLFSLTFPSFKYLSQVLFDGLSFQTRVKEAKLQIVTLHPRFNDILLLFIHREPIND